MMATWVRMDVSVIEWLLTTMLVPGECEMNG
jgi:hypothetical protein